MSEVTEMTTGFEWNRSEVIGLAKESCMHCHGNGMRHGGKGQTGQPCNCVLRAIFRACFARFRHCTTREKHLGRVRLEHVGGQDRRQSWGMKDEEYMADFMLIAQRALSAEDFRLFRFHFLLGASWKLCCRQMKVDRGTFFHSVYRIKQRLGRVFRELRPYALYPLDEYFGGALKGVTPCTIRMAPRRNQLLPPWKKAA